ncbi:hypothetical protein KBY22_15835 [Ruegeria pomeroyi]|uniref:Uncharacterized protein n=1 Tax=Ruegeria alba TaxID=2916756 RepID=A0ABS9NZJ4_9RHOB|nr:hypothetical protein [Ruegeria alba]MCE8514177.1 hypothetical protein [Ruegeria pomeroyi]MCG6559655.1 hypothetical protein [Ruegeria alba]
MTVAWVAGACESGIWLITGIAKTRANMALMHLWKRNATKTRKTFA